MNTNERYELNKNLAQMLKGGVIMDVTTPEQAKIAEAAGIKDQLTALKTNCYFTDELTAAIYAPAFLSETWYTADNGSSVKLTYDKAVNVPEYISKVTSADAYELKKIS